MAIHGNRRRYFNPLSLYRERRGVLSIARRIHEISIHSPYTGRDACTCMGSRTERHFNPLSLYRERPLHSMGFNPLTDFNPLSLYRERRYKKIDVDAMEKFQSTLPIQGETLCNRYNREIFIFQSTLPIQGETLLIMN